VSVGFGSGAGLTSAFSASFATAAAAAAGVELVELDGAGAGVTGAFAVSSAAATWTGADLSEREALGVVPVFEGSARAGIEGHMARQARATIRGCNIKTLHTQKRAEDWDEPT
jgi:hypothetical protein